MALDDARALAARLRGARSAGLVSQLGPSASVTKIRKYTLDLYKNLEKEVDH